METRNGNSPQFVHETEALLMSPFFTDEARADALYEDFSALGYEELGARELVYGGALRILAQARADERSIARLQNPNTFNVEQFNSGWHLTPSRLQTIARSYHEQTGRMARRLPILNNAEAAISDAGDGYAGLHDYQKDYLTDIVAMLQKGPAPVILPEWYDGAAADPKVQGILLKGPTGIGKTALIARTAVSIGAGKSPIEDSSNPECAKPIRIALVAPSQALIAQLIGKTGGGLLRKLAPDIKVTPYYGEEKDLSGDIVVMSKHMFIKDFSDGWIGDQYFDFVFIEEVHHLTEPEFLKAVIERWDGPIIGFTATSAYDKDKDAQNILRYGIDHGDMQTYMERGKLNKLELYTARFTREDFELAPTTRNATEQRPERQQALSSLLGEFAQPLVAQGRRGIIFCEPGEGSSHARTLSKELKKLTLPDGTSIKADAIGSFQGGSNSLENRRVIEQFNNGDIDVLATTIMGQEGLDFADVGFIGLATPLTSSLQFQQMIGRGTRLSKRFKTTVVGQFIPVGFGQQSSRTNTSQSVFGLGHVQQGYILGAAEQGAAANGSEQFSGRLRTILDKTNNLSKELITVQERAFAEGVREIPNDYVLLDDIIADKDIGHHAARLQLIRRGYHGIQQKQQDTPDGQRIVYFEPAAATFFGDKPVPPKNAKNSQVETRRWADRSEIVTVDNLVDYFSTSPDMIYRHLTEAERKQGQQRRVAGHDRLLVWSPEEAEEIKRRLGKKLFLPAHLLIQKGIADLLNVSTSGLKKHIATRGYDIEAEDIEPRGTTKRAYRWSTIQKIQNHFGLRGELKKIDYDLLPLSAADQDAAKVAYARHLQRRVLPVNWLPAQRELRD